jgi:quercetin dioxygenase-like cupin family protein
MRNDRIRRDRRVGAGRAAGRDAGRHAKDSIADGRSEAGYVTILAEATVEAGTVAARHTHPGIETSYVLEGSIELPIQGQPTKSYSAGETYQVMTATPHAGGKASDKRVRILSIYVVEKGKPLASPA